MFVDPTIGLELVTLRTGAIAAGVIPGHLLLTVIALMDVTSKVRRAAGGDIAQSPFLSRTPAAAGLLNVCRTVEADNIGHLQHEDPVLEVFHEFMQGNGHRVPNRLRQVRVDRRR